MCSPVRTRDESASAATVASAGMPCTCRSARSAFCSISSTRAGSGSSPRTSTSTESIPCTTWAAVTTLPSGDTMTPAPVSMKLTFRPPETSRPFALITTTEGLIRRKTSSTLCASTRMGTRVRTSPTIGTHVSRSPVIARGTSLHIAALLGQALQQVEGLDQRAAAREGPEPLLVDRDDLARPVQRRQRAVDLDAERGVSPADHQRVGFVGEELPAQDELVGLLRLLREPGEEHA